MTRTQPNKGIPRHRERGIRMSEFKVIEIKKNILEDNDREADVLRSELKADRTFLLNLMSSPGSGKTTTLVRTIGALKDEMRIGVMEADIDSDVDAKTIAETGAKSIQLHTGGMCHLESGMTSFLARRQTFLCNRKLRSYYTKRRAAQQVLCPPSF